MNKKITSFAGKLTAILVFLAVLHLAFLYVRSLPLILNAITLGYLINFAMALGIYVVLVRFAERRNGNLGFLFLFGSTLKFVVYFLIFNPLFMQDGSLSKLEFFTFFIPYFACLAMETIALVNLLKEID